MKAARSHDYKRGYSQGLVNGRAQREAEVRLLRAANDHLLTLCAQAGISPVDGKPDLFYRQKTVRGPGRGLRP